MSKSLRSPSPLLLVAFAMVGLSACEDDDPSAGTLVVPFQLGNDRPCDSFLVERVRGELDGTIYEDETVCDAGEVRFQQVPAGRYKVRLFGFDADGVAVMDSLQEDDVMLNVVGDGTTIVAERPVKLTAAPAHLLLRWTFGFGSCKSAEIDGFAVAVWRSDGSDLLLQGDIDCERNGDGNDHYRKLHDADRSLDGDEIGEVTVQPQDSGGLDLGEPVTFSFPAPGPGREIKLSLTCEESSCKGSGKPD